jgi:hypothetical protein
VTGNDLGIAVRLDNTALGACATLAVFPFGPVADMKFLPISGGSSTVDFTTSPLSSTASDLNGNDPNQSKGSDSSGTGAIVGGVVGGLLLIVALVLAAVFLRRRSSNQVKG